MITLRDASVLVLEAGEKSGETFSGSHLLDDDVSVKKAEANLSGFIPVATLRDGEVVALEAGEKAEAEPSRVKTKTEVRSIVSKLEE